MHFRGRRLLCASGVPTLCYGRGLGLTPPERLEIHRGEYPTDWVSGFFERSPHLNRLAGHRNLSLGDRGRIAARTAGERCYQTCYHFPEKAAQNRMNNRTRRWVMSLKYKEQDERRRTI